MASDWDTYIKGAALLSTLIVIPTFGWVWSTNVQVQRIQIELESSQSEIENMKSNSVDIQLIKKDIEFIKTHISEVKELLKKP
tara:strand:- start:486 stop:734 length:249 start_codon:yes stop_codon:yes gene_type:complete